jgi:PAS domain S-box-containing protein
MSAVVAPVLELSPVHLSRFLQATLDMLAVGVFWVDQDGRFVNVNQAACDQLGYSRDEMLTMSVPDIDPALPPEAWSSHWEEVLGRGSFSLETTHQTKDGRLRPVEVNVNFIEFDGRCFICSLVRDISDRKAREAHQERVQEKLARRVRRQTTELSVAEERYRQLLDGSNDAIFVHHPTPDDFPGPFVEVNETACRWLGYAQRDLVGRRPTIIMASEPTDELRAAMDKLSREGQSVFEVVLETSSGRLIPAEMNARLFDLRGRPTILTVARDITDRKRSEAALRDSETKFRKLVDEVSVDGIILHDQGITLDVSRPFANMHGYRRKELLGRDALDLIAPDQREQVARRMRAGLEDSYEAMGLRKDGSTFPVEIRVKNMMWMGNRIRAAVVRDVTRQKEAERILREAEEKYRTLFERAGDAIFILEAEGDQIGRIVDANQAAADMHGYTLEELIGRNIRELDTRDPAEYFPKCDQMEPGGEWIKDETEHRKKNGDVFPVEISVGCVTLGGRRFVLAFDRDASQRHREEEERRRLEAQLRQAQKMEAIGTLAGGIAHDFNNVLGAITGLTELVLLDIHPEHDHAQHLNEVLKACRRAKALINQILSFSRVKEQERQPVQVRLVAKEILKLMRASLPTTIDLIADLDVEATVMADPTQIHQMLMNLCTNAGQALAQRGGWLKVGLQLVDLTSDEAIAGLEPGPYLSIEVSDNGPGIDPDLTDRIFDPFFTTKGDQGGTGLGLSVVHGIAQSMGGAVTVDSQPDQGTTFHVLLPAVPSGEVEDGQVETSPLPTGSEHVLFVDDDQVLVEVGRQILSGLGYRVTATTSSPEALDMFRQAPHDFDLVLADQIMPQITGCDLAREIAAIRADVPVLLITGFINDRLDAMAEEAGISRILMKPISVREMGLAVRAAISQNRQK